MENLESNKIFELEEFLIQNRRYLHSIPELGMEEFKTSKFIQDFLTKENIDYKIYSKTGICALIKGEKISPLIKTIGVRADMDALPLDDLKDCPYKSSHTGKMHACGHDAHMSILLGVAKYLNSNKHLFGGYVKLIFEPAEETIGGAKFMIEEGVLSNPNVDAMIGLHVDESLECGKIKVTDGMVNAASNPFKVTIHGLGGHGAYPANSIDPITTATSIINNLQCIVSREINPTHPAVVTIGSIHGGTAPNIIPSDIEFSGIIRTLTKDDREFAVKRLKDITTSIANAHRCTSDIEIEYSYPCLNNDTQLTKLFKEVSTKILGQEHVLNQDKPQMGVESFAYFASEVPSVFYFLGCKDIEKNLTYPAHNSMFDIDEKCLKLGVLLQCHMIVNYLNS